LAGRETTLHHIWLAQIEVGSGTSKLASEAEQRQGKPKEQPTDQPICFTHKNLKRHEA
jgi:hypothetical protein